MEPTCIVLDLDGTLVFSSTKRKSLTKDLCQDISFIGMNGDKKKLWVHKRPGFDTFLKQCFETMIVGVWSMGQPQYVDAVISLFPQKPHFVYNWCDCDRTEDKIFKRLKNIPFDGNAIMIDDNTDVIESCDNVTIYIVPHWTPDKKNDTVLYDLAETLFNKHEPSKEH